MGDVAMMVPVLRVFKQAFPEVKLSILTKPSFAPIFSEFNDVNIITADTKGAHKGFSGIRKLSNHLKQLQIDAVADCHNVLRTKVLKLMMGSPSFRSIKEGARKKDW